MTDAAWALFDDNDGDDAVSLKPSCVFSTSLPWPSGVPLWLWPSISSSARGCRSSSSQDATSVRLLLMEEAEDVLPAACAWLESDGLGDVARAVHASVVRFGENCDNDDDDDDDGDIHADECASSDALSALARGGNEQGTSAAGQHWQLAVAFPALFAAHRLVVRGKGNDAERALQLADRCEILGTSLRAHRAVVALAESALPDETDTGADDNDMFPERLPVADPTDEEHPRLDRIPEQSDAMSVAAFHNRTQTSDRPFVLRGATFAKAEASTAPLVNLTRLRGGAIGARVVPVELGQKEGEQGGSTTMTLRELVDNYLVPSIHADSAVVNSPENGATRPPDVPPDSHRVAYLAQHALFAQCPLLARGLEAPPYVGVHLVKSVNAWIGTRHTVTALHSDADDNLLVQLRGFKYVVLFAPHEAPNLYAGVHPRAASAGDDGAGVGMFSPVRVEKYDADEHANFAQARGQHAVLGPGDALYIPRGWFHYVRSMSTSISLNYWWM